MSRFGWYVALFGVATLVMNLINVDILEWLDQIDSGAGWSLRFAVVVGGLYLVEHARQAKKDEASSAKEYTPAAELVA